MRSTYNKAGPCLDGKHVASKVVAGLGVNIAAAWSFQLVLVGMAHKCLFKAKDNHTVDLCMLQEVLDSGHLVA
jgi:hypothetical protein